MLRTSIQVTALALTLISAFFFLKGSLKLTPKNIADLSLAGAISGMAYNADMAKNWAHQKADTLTGLALLLISFSLQMFDLLWIVRIGDLAVSRPGVFLGLGISALIFFFALYINGILSSNFSRAVMDILNQGG